MLYPDSSKHLNTFIHKILDFLKKYDRALGYGEVEEGTGISVLSNPHLVRSLKMNPKVLLTHQSIQFVPKYPIRSTEDLLGILKGVNQQEGIEMSELEDSPVDIKKFVGKLKSEDKIIVLKDLDGSEIIFYNEIPFSSVRSEIRELWASINIPNYHDITEELRNAGLKGSSNQTVKKIMPPKGVKSKRSKRRITITNTHVRGLDLTGLDDSDP